MSTRTIPPTIPGSLRSGAAAAVDPYAGITLDSPEWTAANARRWELIQKKNREGLTAASGC